MSLPRLKLAFVILASFVLASGIAAKPSERTRILRLCTKTYGPTVDQKQNLFSLNQFYVLRLNFNRRSRLTQLAVEPKYYYADDHPAWGEPDNFPNLSKIEYDRLVTDVDKIKAKGSLVKPHSPGAFVTNMTAWYRETYSNGVLEWGEVVDLRRTSDAPSLVRWFRVYYTTQATSNRWMRAAGACFAS